MSKIENAESIFLAKSEIRSCLIEPGQGRISSFCPGIYDTLDYWNLTTGYMLSFNFNQKKEQGVHPVHIGDRLLYEGTLYAPQGTAFMHLRLCILTPVGAFLYKAEPAAKETKTMLENLRLLSWSSIISNHH